MCNSDVNVPGCFKTDLFVSLEAKKSFLNTATKVDSAHLWPSRLNTELQRGLSVHVFDLRISKTDKITNQLGKNMPGFHLGLDFW